MHGLARLTGAPRFWIFFLGPAVIYTLDKVATKSDKQSILIKVQDLDGISRFFDVLLQTFMKALVELLFFITAPVDIKK